MARFSFVRRDRAFFEMFGAAGINALSAARLLHEMLDQWPDGHEELAREIVEAEREGDRITHDIIHRLNTSARPPLERDDIYGLATRVDDVVDHIEEAADLLGLYGIEAPMEQALELSAVLLAACEQLEGALSDLQDLEGLERYWVEIHRLENDGDRIARDAIASLFADGIDPMVVIRWKDIFGLLEHAIDATEAVAHIIEGVAIKNR